MKAMHDDLVKRLREASSLTFDDWTTVEPYNDYRTAPEAADRIEALTAERDGLIQTSAALCDDCGWSMRFPDCGCVYCGFHRLEAERDALAQKRNDAERVAGALTLENEALQADNARLRAELTKAADSLDWADAHLEDAGVVSANVRYGARDARAASLSEGKPNE
jgi:hypothetical protein